MSKSPLYRTWDSDSQKQEAYALTADAIDDAVFILGPEKGLPLVESLDDCGAIIVDANNKVWISKRLRGLVRVLHAPTDGL